MKLYKSRRINIKTQRYIFSIKMIRRKVKMLDKLLIDLIRNISKQSYPDDDLKAIEQFSHLQRQQFGLMSFNMVLTWGPQCDFIFKTWQTTDDTMFWLGVALSFVACFLTTAYGPIFHKELKSRAKGRLLLTFGFTIEYLLKLFVMLLMMTMNAYVCAAIAFGIALGYTIFSIHGGKIRRKLFDHDLLVSRQMSLIDDI